MWLLLLLLLAATARAEGDHASITEGLDCAGCHTSAGWQMAAGRGGGFDHTRTGFPLLGAHRVTACTGCHDGRKPLPTACAGCHTDAHAGRLGAACAECHTSIDWRDTRTMDRHRRTHLPLTGKHAVIECSSCHIARGEKTFSDVPWDCYACHQQDYRRADIHPNHLGPPAFPRTCGSCHRTLAWSPATLDPSQLPRLAATKAAASHELRFSLSGKHRSLPCASCHLALETPARVACTGCHAHDDSTLGRAHRGRSVGRAAGDCLACHPRGVGR